MNEHEVGLAHAARLKMNWETNTFEELVYLFVGDAYGNNPMERLDFIRQEKRETADEICDTLGVDKNSVVVEIGSGFGFQSKWIAEKVGHLHCFDISKAFLEQAKKECAGINTVSFYHIDKQPAELPLKPQSIDAIFSSAVFIHLNLMDIYWYLAEFSSVIKPGGKVLFDFLDVDDIDFDKFVQTANYYKENIANYRHLINWNSISAVKKIAEYWKFDVLEINRKSFNTVDILLRKR